MVLSYAIVLAVAALFQALALQFAPDLAFGVDMFVVIIGYILAKLGVEVVGKPVANFLVMKVKAFFAPKVKARK